MMPRSVFMWSMAFALFAAYRRVRVRIAKHDRPRMLGYLLAWPGMDAGAFLHPAGVARPAASEWVMAVIKIVFGATLTWVAARAALPDHPLVTGWLGMIGAVFVLHFGVFRLLSLMWHRSGINAVPLMCNPIRSTSLGEFWGRRWNTAFHELAKRFTFAPLRSSVGVIGATLTTFLASGVIHELVFSVPAGGGYGMPTGYFMLQGLEWPANGRVSDGGSISAAAGAGGCSRWR